MAIYHLAVKNVGRSSGRSAVAAAAYRAGDRLTNPRDQVTHDYRRRTGVVAAGIVRPPTASWITNRQALWEAAETAERRKDAVVAREWEVALPSEVGGKEREALAVAFARYLAKRFGVAVDVAIHAPSADGDQRNWHCHMLTTTRVVTPDGLGAKTRELDVKTTSAVAVEEARAEWARLTNHALERGSSAVRVDHRSHARRGLSERPGEHLGPAASAVVRRGRPSARLSEQMTRAQNLAGARQAFAEASQEAQEAIAELKAAQEATRRAQETAQQAEATRRAQEEAQQRADEIARWRALPLGQLNREVAQLRPPALDELVAQHLEVVAARSAKEDAQRLVDAAATAAREAEARRAEAQQQADQIRAELVQRRLRILRDRRRESDLADAERRAADESQRFKHAEAERRRYLEHLKAAVERLREVLRTIRPAVEQQWKALQARFLAAETVRRERYAALRERPGADQRPSVVISESRERGR